MPSVRKPGKHTHAAVWGGREENRLEAAAGPGLARLPFPRRRRLTPRRPRDPAPAVAPGAQRTWCGTWTGAGGWAWGAEGPLSAGGARTTSGTTRGETEARKGPVGIGVSSLLVSAPTSCFLWGGAEVLQRSGVTVGLMGVEGGRGQCKALEVRAEDAGARLGQGGGGGRPPENQDI